MKNRIVSIILLIGVFLSAFVFVNSYNRNFRYPGNNEGYEPIQPISYSHRLHAGELGIACLHCHAGAERSRHAGIPSMNICMNCHQYVTAPLLEVKAEDDRATEENRKPRVIVSPELRKIYDAVGLDEQLKSDPHRPSRSVEWIRVHKVPDFVYFDHRAHVTVGVECQTCHGAVETMERVRQVSDLSMGWCVNCHRDANRDGVKGKKVKASTDCTACHY